MNCVEEPLRWRLQTSLFFASTEKNISLFVGELLLRKLSIQSINEFLENRDQNPLDTRSFFAIFTKYLRLTFVLIIIKLDLQIKAI